VIEGYDFIREQFPELLIRRFFPEKTDRESGLLKEFLARHLHEYDRVSFSVRIGEGIAPNPSHLPGVQKSTAFSSRRRIDMVLWHGPEVTICEAKDRLRHDVLGQLLSDRQLWLEERPDDGEPKLVAIGRTSDAEIERILTAHGIALYIYDEADTA
jgi:hypothetical protein